MGGMLENLKTAVGMAQKIGSIEVQQKLIDVQGEALEMIDDNRVLRGKIAELTLLIKTKKSLAFRNNFYWTTIDDGSEEGPFCSSCWDAGDKLVRLHEFEKKYFGCPSCGRVRAKDGDIPAYPQAADRFNNDRLVQSGKTRRR